MADLYFSAKTYNSVSTYLSIDSARSGLQFDWYVRGGSFSTWTYASTSFSDSFSTSYYYTFFGLSSSTTYDFNVEIKEFGSKVADLYLYSITTDPPPNPRPSNWSWWSNKVSGQSFQMSASEWNSFTYKINQFRSYKYMSPYYFSTVSTSQSFQAYLFNQAVSALNDLSGYMGYYAVPSYVSSGDKIYASYFNNMRDSLNSIS